MIWEVSYLLCDQRRSRVVVAPDQVRAWVVVFRGHFCPAELIEVRRLG